MTAYWFKRRRYGWGFTPSAWQGWTLTVALVVAVVVPAFWLDQDASTRDAVGFVVYVVVVVLAFVGAALLRSPRPRWRWGRSPGDDPDEDF